MSNIALINALKILLAESVIISSNFSKAQQNYLNDLAKQTGIIKCSKQGRGFSYQVVNATALQSYLNQLQPLNEFELPTDLPTRSRNIGLYKNSKQISPKHDICYLLLKAVGDTIFWNDTEGKYINISEQTQSQGVSSLVIQTDDNWQSQQPLFLVENQALFDRLDWLPANFNGTVIYYGGNMKQRLLNWLGYKTRASELILFADYDGVGFSNFLRLFCAVENKQVCHFYLMPDWQNKLKTFGNAKIWRDNQVRFYNAVQGLSEINALTDELNDLIKIMQTLGKGLEQEAIWL